MNDLEGLGGIVFEYSRWNLRTIGSIICSWVNFLNHYEAVVFWSGFAPSFSSSFFLCSLMAIASIVDYHFPMAWTNAPWWLLWCVGFGVLFNQGLLRNLRKKIKIFEKIIIDKKMIILFFSVFYKSTGSCWPCNNLLNLYRKFIIHKCIVNLSWTATTFKFALYKLVVDFILKILNIFFVCGLFYNAL